MDNVYEHVDTRMNNSVKAPAKLAKKALTSSFASMGS
jgi:hypothetical protein